MASTYATAAAVLLIMLGDCLLLRLLLFYNMVSYRMYEQADIRNYKVFLVVLLLYEHVPGGMASSRRPKGQTAQSPDESNT